MKADACAVTRFRADGKPKWVLWCHCESCRGHSGAPASVFISFPNDAVTVTHGAIAKYASSPGVERGFCGRCGSTLTCTNPKLPNETHFHIGAFERAPNLRRLAPFSLKNDCRGSISARGPLLDSPRSHRPRLREIINRETKRRAPSPNNCSRPISATLANTSSRACRWRNLPT
ncbi:MAG: GFA family protein [Rhodospirillales bacterium]|nr:GFA family protein [Rhodospirillales bacterium]